MNNPCGPVPLLFITGFLGSGKTTLLNRILDEAAAQGKKIGVIINEWGRVNIDSSLIRAKDIEIEELNDGQVFCSCLSGNFLEARQAFSGWRDCGNLRDGQSVSAQEYPMRFEAAYWRPLRLSGHDRPDRSGELP